MIEFEEYFGKIVDGKIVACDKMKRISEILLENYLSPSEYHFDSDIAKRHTKFVETFCKLPSGNVGQPLKLELFQKARLQAIFGFVDDNDVRQYNECLIIEGRKNGKTTETAAVEIDMLIDDKEGSPQIYNIATMLDQAKLGFNAAVKMVRREHQTFTLMETLGSSRHWLPIVTLLMAWMFIVPLLMSCRQSRTETYTI